MTGQSKHLQVLLLAAYLVAGSVVPAICEELPDDLPYKYVGNNFSLKFHRPSCLFARAMAPVHIELYHFRKQAVEAGMQPCRYCLPANWKTVRATVLSPQESNQADSNDETK